MIGIESAWCQLRDEGGMKPRQLFITRSQHLADKVKEEFTRLHETHVSGGASTSVDANTPGANEWAGLGPFPAKFSALKDCHFPVFVSFDEVRARLMQYIKY